MSLLLIQLLILFFVLFAVVSVFRRLVKKEISRGVATGWLALWVLICIAVLLPRTTEWVAEMLGVGRGVDAVMYLSIVVLFFLQYRTLLRMEKMEHAITEAVRRDALGEFEKEEKN
jgi:hypothetical protein